MNLYVSVTRRLVHSWNAGGLGAISPVRSRSWSLAWIPIFLGLSLAHPSGAELVPLPNASFESPATSFADPRIDGWQKLPKPAFHDEATMGPWDQLTGVFLNTGPDKPDHIINLDGQQAMFLFALPSVGITLGAETGTLRAFNVPFESGRSYRLSAGVLGGGGGMKEGVTLELALFYRDSSGEAVTIASTTVTNEGVAFNDRTRMTRFEVQVPPVRSGDAWAGKSIGIRIGSTVRPELSGGYWDIENVQLYREIQVPNGSFESPQTVFADPRLDSWRKSPTPAWFDETANGPWTQLTGVFLNTPADKPDHIANIDGHQAMFLFALPTVEVSIDRASVTPGDFDIRCEPGRTYQLSAGVLGGGGGMAPGVTLELELYYLAADGRPGRVASTSITNTTELFADRTRFRDFTVQLPQVRATDPWAGRNLGIRIASTVRPELAGGYWDVENIRLSEVRGPSVQNPLRTVDGFSFTIQSDPGSRVEVLRATGAKSEGFDWQVISVVTNTTGGNVFTDPTPIPGAGYYGVRTAP